MLRVFGQFMSCTPEAAVHLVQSIADLVRTANSDVPPPEILDLLCVQIGTAQYWLDQLQGQVDPGHELAGPHFGAQPRLSPNLRSSSLSNRCLTLPA